MSTEGRKVLALAAATVAVLTLAAVVLLAAVVNRGGEAQADIKVDKVTDNKGKDAPGMCVYSEESNKYKFKNVPNGDKDEDDPVKKELDRGGRFADSQADCDELNDILAEPPKADGKPEAVPDSAKEGPRVDLEDVPDEAFTFDEKKAGKPKQDPR